MKEAYAFNLKSYRLAENIFVLPADVINPHRYVLDDFASAESDSPIYIAPYGYNNYIIYTQEPIYMNTSCHGLARDLTKLKSCDFFNTDIFNYKYVRNMHTSFTNCWNLEAHPISPRRVSSLYGTYYDCRNITGTPKIGLNANNLIGTYYNCQNLNGTMQNSTNVVSMIGTYYNCFNIESNPPEETSAKSMYDCFYNCTNLYGAPANCNNAFITINAYYNCTNIYGTFYWMFNGFHQASKVNAVNMFYGRDPSRQLVIHTWENYAIANALLNYSNNYGNIYGAGELAWSQISTYVYYNASYNTLLTLWPDDTELD